jgi:hypothetical protein
MKPAMKKAGFLLFLFGLVQIVGGCIMEDRVVELVVNESTCVEFEQDEYTVTFMTPVTVWYADEINKILEDNDISRDDIVTARLVSANYGVTEFPDHPDWLISGSVTIQREDSTRQEDMDPNTLWSYQDLSVYAAIGKKIPAILNQEGVGVLNRALDDFLAGRNPVLTFRVENANVTPTPTTENRLIFKWKGCISVDIVAKSDIEVPDPF